MDQFEIKCGKCGSCYNSRAKMISPIQGNSTTTSGNQVYTETRDASCPVCGFSGILENTGVQRKILCD